MSRQEVVFHMEREPDHESTSSGGAAVIVWDIKEPEKDRPGDYVGVQLGNSEQALGLRNPPRREVKVGEVRVTLQDGKVVEFRTSKSPQ
jgi:hypothetical protein